jgi:hypothetical protein
MKLTLGSGLLDVFDNGDPYRGDDETPCDHSQEGPLNVRRWSNYKTIVKRATAFKVEHVHEGIASLYRPLKSAAPDVVYIFVLRGDEIKAIEVNRTTVLTQEYGPFLGFLVRNWEDDTEEKLAELFFDCANDGDIVDDLLFAEIGRSVDYGDYITNGQCLECGAPVTRTERPECLGSVTHEKGCQLAAFEAESEKVAK